MQKANLTDPATQRLTAVHWGFLTIIGLFWLAQVDTLQMAYIHDFLNLYTGASLAAEGRFSELHDVDAQFAREQELIGEIEEVVPFVRPHFYALALAPLAWLSYKAAFGTWILLQTALLVGCWIWARRLFGPDSLVFAALYVPTAAGILSGQDCVILAVLAIAAYTLAEGGRDLRGGLVLGLGLFKFHLLLFVPLAMLLRRPKMLLGFAVTGAVAASLSPLLGGRIGIESYISLLTNKDLARLSPAPERMINIHALALNAGIDHIALKIFGIVVVALLVVIAARSAPLWRWMTAAIAGSILAVPHVYGYDAGILLPLLLLTVFRSKDPYSRFLATTFLTPLPFLALSIGPPWTFIPALVLFSFLAALARESYLEHKRPGEIATD